MARITLDQVVKSFAGRRGRNVRALDALSLDVAEGELLAVLGPSGCGKTTLLRLIAGLETPTSGTIHIDGQPAARDPQDRNLAMVFQQDALLPHLTARENIALGLRLRGQSRAEIEARVQEADALIHLGPALDRLPRALSGGERQRAALARAFVRRPRAFLLDEPFSSLDACLRSELRGKLLEMHRQSGVTIIHVTHDQAEALAIGHRVAVLDRGVLQQMASARDLYLRPANAFVAGFIGSPPMNLFRGSLLHQGGAVWFQAAAPGLALCLTDEQRPMLGKAPGNAIVIGLRAEDIVAGPTGRSMPYGCEVTASVQAVEWQGADALVHWSGGSSGFATRATGGDVPKPGESRSLIFDMSRAMFFDATSGLALGPGGSEGHPQPI